MPRPQDVARITTEELRSAFLVADIFQPAQVRGQFTDLDRLVLGGVAPTATPVELSNHKESGRASFLERRELGALNIGGPGVVHVDPATLLPQLVMNQLAHLQSQRVF
jgi:4-deoxy-L-threo-5-hexosulose-uronate ketol-isomerase